MFCSTMFDMARDLQDKIRLISQKGNSVRVETQFRSSQARSFGECKMFGRTPGCVSL
jgi:hypothetical protein